MKDIKTVEFVFENCEVITIDKIDSFGYFYMDGIWSNIQRCACNAISKFDYVDEVYIEIFKKADGEHYPFDDKEHFENEEETIFDRIKYGDITSINITYTDDSTEDYYVAYEEQGSTKWCGINIHQDTNVSEQGNLYLVISKDNKKVKDVFEDVFEEAEYREKMYAEVEINQEEYKNEV